MKLKQIFCKHEFIIVKTDGKGMNLIYGDLKEAPVELPERELYKCRKCGKKMIVKV